MWNWLLRRLSGIHAIDNQWRNLAWDQVPFLAIDLELTSLQPDVSEMVSIGWVEGFSRKIALSSCFYSLIDTSENLQQSPVIHGLTASELAKGQGVEQVLSILQPYASSHCWVFHNAQLDCRVLARNFSAQGMTMPQITTVDTLRLALYQLQKRGGAVASNAATLTMSRQRVGLPLAPAHNALDDAMATLELLFAQMSEFDRSGRLPLSEFLHTGAIRTFNHQTR